MIRAPFRGRRITMRPFEPDDLLALADYLNHPALTGCRYTYGLDDTLPVTQAAVERLYARWSEQEQGVTLAVLANDTLALLGHAFAHWGWDRLAPDLAVVISPEQRRQGYASEAFQLLLGYLFGFTPAVHAASWVADWNTGGIAFLTAQGFQAAGHMRHAGLRDSRPYDMLVMDILRDEWAARQKEG